MQWIDTTDVNRSAMAPPLDRASYRKQAYCHVGAPFGGLRWHLPGVLALAALTLSGCIAKDGPTGLEVRGAAAVRLEDAGRLSYAFVKLSPLVLRKLQTEQQYPALFSRLAQLARPADVRLTAADSVSVTIFEAAAGGLFIPKEAGVRPGNFIQIPAQDIDRGGNINIPYGGAIRALGRTPREIEADIVAKLKERAIEPQVVVTVGERASNSISVLGDVRASTNIAMRPGGIRLLAAIARAGGPQFAPHSTIVTVQRRGRTEQALLTSIIKHPQQNIELAPEDVVYVSTEPRVYSVFGATGSVNNSFQIGLSSSTANSGRRFVMDRENVSLTEGLATAGGPSAGTADPRSVFLFRYVPRALLSRAGVDVSRFPGPQVPTVFTVDLSKAEGYFLANHLFMKHNDIIYVSESPSVDLIKFLNIIGAVSTTTRDVLGVASDARNLGR